MSIMFTRRLDQYLMLIIILIANQTHGSTIAEALFRNYLGNDLTKPETAYERLTGYVDLYQNVMWYDLDFSAVDWSLFESGNCSEDVLSFHIHDKWTYGTTGATIGFSADKIGIECHENFTGRHFDPWMACGPASGNAACESYDGCIPSSSIYQESEYYLGDYSCDEINFDLVAYSCEMGDLSGKYGYLDVFEWDNATNETVGINIFGEYGSYWEIQDDLLFGGNSDPALYSIVIHCGDEEGEPLFCAPILQGNNAYLPDLDLTDVETVLIDLSEADAVFENFTISFDNQGVSFHIPLSAEGVCNEWYLQLYEEYPYFEEGAAFHNCDVDEFGGIYDPTHTCIENSGSLYCQDMVRCPDESNVTVNYYCGPDNFYMGCAVGDISARIDSIIPDFTGSPPFWDFTFPITMYSPPLFILNARGIVLSCLDGNNATLNETENICGGTFCENCTQTLAPITNNTANPTMQTSGPTFFPTYDPTSEPTTEPTNHPTSEPTTEPTSQPSTVPTTQPSSEDEDEDEAGLSTGAIAGIGVAAVIALIICILLLWCFVIKPKKERKSTDEQAKGGIEAATLKKMKSDSNENMSSGDEITGATGGDEEAGAED